MREYSLKSARNNKIPAVKLIAFRLFGEDKQSWMEEQVENFMLRHRLQECDKFAKRYPSIFFEEDESIVQNFSNKNAKPLIQSGIYTNEKNDSEKKCNELKKINKQEAKLNSNKISRFF